MALLFPIAIRDRNKNSKHNGNTLVELSVVEVKYLFKESMWKSGILVSMPGQDK